MSTGQGADGADDSGGIAKRHRKRLHTAKPVEVVGRLKPTLKHVTEIETFGHSGH